MNHCKNYCKKAIMPRTAPTRGAQLVVFFRAPRHPQEQRERSVQPPARLRTGWGCSWERKRCPKRSVIFGTINKCCPSRRRELQKGQGGMHPALSASHGEVCWVLGSTCGSVPCPIHAYVQRFGEAVHFQVLFRAMLVQPRLGGDGGQEEPLHISSALSGSFEFL